MNVNEINECFKNGYIHNCLFYTTEPIIMIDPRKISYTDYYQSYNFYESKFHSQCYSIPGFDNLINHMKDLSIKNNNTPLNEINKKISMSN